MLFDSFRRKSLRRAVAMGFELGNHTHSHLDLTILSKEELQTEIDKTDKYLSLLDGRDRHLLRAPFGKIDEFVKSNSPAPLIDWTIDTLDWTGKSQEYIFHQIFSNLFNGAIVLMHDGYEHTVSALKELLPALKAADYQVVSVAQLAKAHNCVLKRGERYIRARKAK
jgi:peptidoglycan/xylan/chitin deacetylase (PgdA/CDA1 family)